jgi:hypothetical protein
MQALAGGQQFDSCIAAVGHYDQHPLGQPHTKLRDHLTSPVGELLVTLAALLMVALGGRKDGQKGQRPHPLGPRNGGEQHHTQPAQPAGFDEERARGAHGVAVDALGLDFGPTATLDMVVEADHNGRVGWNEARNQQAQQDAAGGVGRPDGTVEHAMVVLELCLVAQPHHPQGSGDSTFAWSQNGAEEQDLCPFPYALTEQQLERPKDLYNRSWQVAHGWPLPGSRVPVKRTLPPLFRLPNG